MGSFQTIVKNKDRDLVETLSSAAPTPPHTGTIPQPGLLSITSATSQTLKEVVVVPETTRAFLVLSQFLQSLPVPGRQRMTC